MTLPTSLRATLILTTLVGVMGVLGCRSDTDEQPGQSVFRYNESAGITSLDPIYSRSLENIWACNALYNSLVRIGDDLSIEPSLAATWTIDSTGTIYTFTLRKGLRFHDDPCFENGRGREVVASDVAYSLNRLRDPELASPGAWVLSALRPDSALRLHGDTGISMHLSKPFPPFLGILAMQYCAVVPVEAIQYYGEDFRKHPVGTGPFEFNFWIENLNISLVKNPSYWEVDSLGAALPYLDAVLISFIPDKGAAYLDFLNGKYDLLSGLHSSYNEELLNRAGQLRDMYRGRFYLQSFPALKTDYLGFMLETELPWRDARLRKAISYAIDREAMVKYLYRNVYTAAHGGFIPPGMPAHCATAGYRFNPDSVRFLLGEAGYPGGKGLPTLVLSTTADYANICEYVQHQLGEFGIRTAVDVMPASVHRERVAQGDLMFFRKSWIADYPDAENFLTLFYSENEAPQGPNYTHFAKEAFDELYLQALRSTDPVRRDSLYRIMDALVMKEAPVVNLYYDRVMRFVARDVTGLDTSPINILDLSRVKKTPTLAHQ